MNITPLKSIAENIKFLEVRKKELSDEIAAIYSEAKSNGFNTRVLKKLIAIKDPDQFKLELEEMRIYSDVIQLNLFD